MSYYHSFQSHSRPITPQPYSMDIRRQEFLNYLYELRMNDPIGYRKWYENYYLANPNKVPPPASRTSKESTPDRMTPHKFTTPHAIARFTPGGHLLIIKCEQVTAEIHPVKSIVTHTDEFYEIEQFPGPLVRGRVHKTTVIQFCQKKIKEALANENQIDRENFILIWEYLIQLLRQNGTMDGSDVAEILLKKSESDTRKETPSPEDLYENRSVDDESESTDNSKQVAPTTSDDPFEKHIGEERLVKTFSDHLLCGHTKEALDYAARNNLWGHALVLASKMGDSYFKSAMNQFVGRMNNNDPLVTLYEVMGGKIPSSSRKCCDNTFGDWKPHLAMMLSNTGFKPDIETKSIVAMGDTLRSRNQVYGAQFCYLMAQLEFSSKTKLGALIGLAPDKSNVIEATQMTEIYEFARTLAYPNYWMGQEVLQTKLDYIKLLISYGFCNEAYSYCEEIAQRVRQQNLEISELHSRSILEIAERLRPEADDISFPNTSSSQQETPDLSPVHVPINGQPPSALPIGAPIDRQPPNAFSVDAPIEPQPPVIVDAPMERQQPVILPATDGLVERQQQNIHSVDVGLERQTPSAFSISGPVERQPPNLYPIDTPIERQPPIMYQVDPPVERQQPNAFPSNRPVERQPSNTFPFQAPNNIQEPNTFPVDAPFDYQHQQPNTFPIDAPIPPLERQQPKRFPVNPPNNRAPVHAPSMPSKQQPKEGESKKEEKKKSSWLPSIFPSFKPKNQMILPDDKEPSIVWDDQKKRWVNKSGEDEGDNGPAKPPPSDFDLNKQLNNNNNNSFAIPPRTNSVPNFQLGTAAPQQPDPSSYAQQYPSPSLPFQSNQNFANQPMSLNNPANSAQINTGAAAPASSVNKYKLPKGRTLRSSYVDVFNPNSGTTISSSGPNPSKSQPSTPFMQPMFTPAPPPPELLNDPNQPSFFTQGGISNGVLHQSSDNQQEGHQ